MILIGKLIDSLGAVHHTEPVRDPRDPIGWRIRDVYRHEPLELRSVAAGAPITDGHRGRRLGSLRHVEITETGDVWVTADVHQPLPAGDAHGKLYLSLEGASRGQDFTLAAVALTTHPAMMLPPIEIVAERTIDELPEDVTLRMRRTSPHSAALLERARAAARAWPRPDSIIEDRRPAHTPPATGPVLTRAAGWADDQGRLHGSGGWWHGPAGSVLAVR